MRLFCRNVRCITVPRRHSWLGDAALRIILSLCCASLLVLLVIPAATRGYFWKGAEDAGTSRLQMKSGEFGEGGEIPRKFSCEGEDVSPSLSWTDPPRGTQSFTLIVDDPDAPGGTWVHWVVFDLPARTHNLPSNVPKQARITGGGLQGRNDFGRIGYGGPCPPPGDAHRYFFKLYALDALLKLPPGSTKGDILKAADGHVLAEARLMGRFKR